MRRNIIHGFTILELLIVITILGLLTGIMIPAVQVARESARRNLCIKNQKNIAAALINYEQYKKGFPYWRHFVKLEPALPANQGGNVNYVNYTWMKFGRSGTASMGVFGYGNYTYTGWLPQLFPYIEMQPLYNILVTTIDNTPGEVNRKPTGLKLPTLWCPSSGGQENRASSFVANCGFNDSGWGKRYPNDYFRDSDLNYDFDIPGETGNADGVFKDGVLINKRGDTCGPRMSMEEIFDGLSNTMLISENVQAGNMWTYREDVVGFCWPWVYENNANGRTPETPGSWDFWDFYNDPAEFGCSKLAEGRPYTNNSAEEGVANPTQPLDGYTYNESRPMAPNMCRGYFEGNRGYTAARPSSYHSGIFNASFADGSVKAINENIDRKVYIQSMTPCDAESVCLEINDLPFSPSAMFE